MVIVFDLDDTLFSDLSYVRSGYRAVARELVTLCRTSEEDIYAALIAELNVSRTQVFDRFLEKIGLKSEFRVKSCLAIYRQHAPDIHLFPEAIKCLEELKNYPLYVVTDGNNRVQRKKFMALGLNQWIRKCLCTYSYGIKYSKPSPYCFERICQLEGVMPQEVVYIADNPHKDFVGIKPLGFQTIRVLTGPYRDVNVSAAYDAEVTISDLSKLTSVLNL